MYLCDVISNTAYEYITDVDLWYLDRKLRRCRTFNGTVNQNRNKIIDDLLKNT
jgi:hypothetical protein